MFISVLLSTFLVLITVIWHYWVILKLYAFMPQNKEHSHFLRSILILLTLFSNHVLEVLWFSGGYYLGNEYFNIGGFTEGFQPIFRDYFYYSTVTYSTLGLSSFESTGHLKLMTGIESLTGFIMITWSASFFYNLTNRGIKT